METYKRPQSNSLRWLWVLAACAGTLLLTFVPSGAWLDVPNEGEPALYLLACFLKQFLTVALLLIVPALLSRAAYAAGAYVLAGFALLSFGAGYLLSHDWIAALCTMLLVMLPGAGLYVLFRLRLNNFRTVLYGSVLVLFALFGYICLKDLIESGNAYLPFKTIITAYERVFRAVQPDAATFGNVYGAAVAELIDAAKLAPEAIGLPVLVIPAMCAGLSNVLFSHLMNRDGAADLAALPPFSQWRCERVFVYASAGFALVTYVLAMMNVNGMDTLANIALLVWRFPCALAGLSALRALSIHVKKTWIFIIVCVASAVMPGFGLTVLSLVGMFASIGRRMNNRKDGTLS